MRAFPRIRLPKLAERAPAPAPRGSSHTRLGRAVEAAARSHEGESGIVTLAESREAFAARALLADAAESTLDLRYYIWRGDTSGMLLYAALLRAAERGVRVRLLLDDNNTVGLDPLLAALDAHPNIEVRLFNPFVNRRWRALGYLVDFDRLNRRMHNKSFTADNQATIVGGRNIGDEYFGASDETAFVDLDVLAVGPVVQEVAEDFERYWACESARAAADVLKRPEASARSLVEQRVAAAQQGDQARAYTEALHDLPLVRDLLDSRLDFEWSPVRMVSDDPAKGLGRACDSTMLPARFIEVLGKPAHELLLVSAYFVPMEAGVRALAAMAGRGVRVSVLTNALEATDVAPVHAGYSKHRRALLEAGIALYELKREASADDGNGGSGPLALTAWKSGWKDGWRQAMKAPWRAGSTGGGTVGATRGQRRRLRAAERRQARRERLRRWTGHGGDRGLTGSSASSLHAKTFAVDGRRAYVGSFNLDPRSAELNTEMGFVIDSPKLASRIGAFFGQRLPQVAYQLELDAASGRLAWREQRGGATLRHEVEPGTGPLLRLAVRLMSWLPIDHLL